MGETVGETKGSNVGGGAETWLSKPTALPVLTARAQPRLLVLGRLHGILGSHLSGTQVPGDLMTEGRAW